MKYILVFLILLCSCSTPQKEFYTRKHPHESKKSYQDKRGLMLLENTQLGRNKYITSKKYADRLKKTHRRLNKPSPR